MLVDHAKAMQRVCFGSEPSDADLELLGSRERWLVYRGLVRNRLNVVIGVALTRTKNAIGKDAFSRTVDEWFSTGGPKTRYLRYVPSELAEFAIPIWQRTEAPWVADLAGYEISSWEVRHGPRNPMPSAEFAFDRNPVVATAVKVLRNLLEGQGHPPLFQFEPPPPASLLVPGSEEDFDFGIGEDYGSDVPSVHDHSAAVAEALLDAEEGSADLGEG